MNFFKYKGYMQILGSLAQVTVVRLQNCGEV